MKIHKLTAPNGRICWLETAVWDHVFLCNGKVGDGQKSPSSVWRGKFPMSSARKAFTCCVLSARNTHHPVLRERFKLQPSLFEEKLKVLDPESVLPTAFQAALLLCSRCEAGRCRLHRLRDPFPLRAAMCRHSLCVMRPRSSQVLWKVMTFLLMAVSCASLATVKVNSWRKMQKYLLALGTAWLPEPSWGVCVWFPSSKQPFENLPSLSLSSQSFYHLHYELHQRNIRHMESCSAFFTRAQRAPWYQLTQRGFRTSVLEGLSAFGSCYRSASTEFFFRLLCNYCDFLAVGFSDSPESFTRQCGSGGLPTTTGVLSKSSSCMQGILQLLSLLG